MSRSQSLHQCPGIYALEWVVLQRLGGLEPLRSCFLGQLRLVMSVAVWKAMLPHVDGPTSDARRSLILSSRVVTLTQGR